MMSDMARIGAKQILDELAASDPQFAAEQRRHEREMRAWRRERRLLSAEISRLSLPIVVVALNPELKDDFDGKAISDMAAAVLRVSHYLFDNDAPAALICDLLETCRRVVEPC